MAPKCFMYFYTFNIFLHFHFFVFCIFCISVHLYFSIFVFLLKNGWVLSTLYFYAQFSILRRPPPPQVLVVFEGFQMGSPSPSPDISCSNVPQLLFTSQNVAIKKGIHLGVVPNFYDRLGRSYRCWSCLQQIYSFYLSPNLSKIYSSGMHRYTHTHTSWYVETPLTR